eukprot:SM000049S16717  [mRNA]  locus=s49:255873:258330:- [translate_table: standard]
MRVVGSAAVKAAAAATGSAARRARPSSVAAAAVAAAAGAGPTSSAAAGVGGEAVSWFPGHMAQAAREMRQRLQAVDLVLEVRDARIPLSSANQMLADMVAHKRRLLLLNKRELANRNLEQRWTAYFDQQGLRSLFISAQRQSSIRQVLNAAQHWLTQERRDEATLLVMVLGVPNVGKSALINGLHRLAAPVQAQLKRAKVGPLPGVTRDLAAFKVGVRPSTYVLDTPGVMVPRVSDLETGLKLALTGAVKDAVVGEQRLARYLLSLLNERFAGHLLLKATETSPAASAQGPPIGPKEFVMEALNMPWAEEEGRASPGAMACHVDRQLQLLRRRLKVPVQLGDAGDNLVAQQLLQLYRHGALGCYTLDPAP